MKYLGAFCLMLFCNEVLSLIALVILMAFFLTDMAKEAGKR